MARRLTALAGLALLASCGSDDSVAPGGVTEGEARALNEAAAATDINAVQPTQDTDATPAP